MLQVTEGLEALHKAGHLHGNLCTENVLLCNMDREPTAQNIDIQVPSDA